MRTPSLTLVVLLLGACAKPPEGGNDGSGTLGEKGEVQFEYQRSCFFGCPLEQPLLAGAAEVVAVDGPGDAAGTTARVTDPEIAEVATSRGCHCERKDGRDSDLQVDREASCPDDWYKQCDNTFPISALAPGETTLELVTADGEVVDRAPIRIADAADARYYATYPDQFGEVEGTAIDLAVSERVKVRAELYADDGLALLAPEGVSWTVSDEVVASVAAFTFGSGKAIQAGLGVDVAGLAAGSTDLEIAVPGLTSTLAVTVTAP